MMDITDDDSIACPGCSAVLMTPYIRCAQCPHRLELCLHCFSRGFQIGDHKNDHSYYIIKNDFPLYENHWSAGDELRLLQAIENFGYGNWKEIGIQMKNKSGSECERHYNKCYINNPQPPLPVSDDPPRPAEGSNLCTDMAGYSAARGDFAVEHDNFAEMEICNLTFDPAETEDDEEDQKLINDMKFSLLHSYHRRLRERHRRKRILKEYGLISLQKQYATWRHAHDRGLRQLLDDMRVFTTLLSPDDWEKFLEGMNYVQELKAEINRLKEYRANGLTRLHSIRPYIALRARRLNSRHKRHLLSDVISHIRDEAACQSWLQRHAVSDASKVVNLPLPLLVTRRVAPPLDIEGLPSCERLSSAEKELCQRVRLVPEAYLEFRTMLINECRKHDGLRLAQARTLIKIDVNKTRKLYDFLLQEGQIKKPS
ncbi:hypothetical protein BaRGS_00027209 [Batillaria attramentaria]|uniref:Transcriptional adapter n=1 Tax=Batillaria attramentaria TaxID=370345 RepID=A0ABD0K3J1_9CAEN